MTTRANEDIESFATLTRQITRHKSRVCIRHPKYLFFIHIYSSNIFTTTCFNMVLIIIACYIICIYSLSLQEEALASEESWRERDAARARALASEDVPPEHLNRKQSKKWVAERKKSQLARQRSAEAAAGML